MVEKPRGQWTISLGRVATCALMVQAMWCWHKGVDLLTGQKDVLYVLLGYTFGNNIITGAKEIAGTVSAARSNDPSDGVDHVGKT